MLLSAVGNLLDNVFKFTRHHTGGFLMPTQLLLASISTLGITAVASRGRDGKGVSAVC